MSYSTIAGTKRKISDELWNDTEIDVTIENTFIDVKSWVNSVLNRNSDFTEDDLVGDDAVIRLAADCYCACRIMSEALEGHGIDQESLAKYRCSEARECIRSWAANHGIVPTFDSESYVPVGVDFAVEVGSDSVTIG